jgi:hypothetical protein
MIIALVTMVQNLNIVKKHVPDEIMQVPFLE